MTAEIEWDQDALDAFIASGVSAAQRAVELTAIETWGNIAKEAPVDHGRLAGSFDIEQRGDFEWAIFSNVLYALFVHEGTGIHGPTGMPITPTNANMLRFVAGGEVVYAQSVQGSPANPYADRALLKAEQRVDDFIRTALEEEGVAA